jgi:Raf kinase inhibitor-like YbhB/YbcL family protein
MCILVATFLALACTLLGSGSHAESGDPDAPRLTSSAFADGGEIPVRYTCGGDDVSPPLAWSNLPEGTRSLALVVDDPDAPDPKAPKVTWIHWLVYNIPPESAGLVASASPGNLPRGAKEGRNSWKRTGYGGPCPPIGRHRYFHRLYALDAVLPDLDQPTQGALSKAMEVHVLSRFELVGTYER